MEHEKEYVLSLIKELKLKSFITSIEESFKILDSKNKNEVVNIFKICCEKECSERRSSLIASRIKAAKFRQIQTVEQFDFNHNKLTQRIEKSFLILHNIISKNNLPKEIFVGTPGLGKTHLARSLGYVSC